MIRIEICCLAILLFAGIPFQDARADDPIRDLQAKAVEEGKSPAAHWGNDPKNYTAWGTHSNRLIPVYAFGTKGAGQGIDLESYTGPRSAYRREDAIRKIYGKVPSNTRNPAADYMDQTDIAALQRAALAAGKKHVMLVIFDGMDWQTTRAAAIYNEGKVSYQQGRGTGTHFQNYTADGTTQFGFMVTSPNNEGTEIDVDTQTVKNPGGKISGGYNAQKAGPNPWTPGDDAYYPIGQTADNPKGGEHAYPDSASTAQAMMSGVKTYNNAINIDPTGAQVSTVASEAQEKGYAIGAVSSVPISHATPACAYAHNVHRDDYQDISRDMLGLPSISHPKKALAGMDVVIGGGFGAAKTTDAAQGKNFIPGNRYLAPPDLQTIDVSHGGRYVVAKRTPLVDGAAHLQEAADEAARSGKRLLGFYGCGPFDGHLPYQTADKDYEPAPGRAKKAEFYSAADLKENPTLAQMTEAALTVLAKNSKGFWLMVEAGDVDWANHDNNLDNSIGAVNSGDDAVEVITDWVEANSNWKESVLIVTADHGHYLMLDRPELLAKHPKSKPHAKKTAKAAK